MSVLDDAFEKFKSRINLIQRKKGHPAKKSLEIAIKAGIENTREWLFIEFIAKCFDDRMNSGDIKIVVERMIDYLGIKEDKKDETNNIGIQTN